MTVVAVNELAVEFLFRLQADTVSTPPVVVPGGPQGTRMIATVAGGAFEGPTLKGSVADCAGGDWVTVRSDGTLRLDVRLALETHDGATILMTYNGVGRRVDDRYTLRAAPTFQTGDERYAWLNDIQAVAHGETTDDGVRYDVYALL
jgi:hypothetical protein